MRREFNHFFNVQDACDYGVPCALVLAHLRWWVLANAHQGEHFYDGRWWAYRSTKAIGAALPYFSEDQLRRTLKKLVDEGVILVGQWGKEAGWQSWNHTNWYSFSDEERYLETAGSMARNRRIEAPEPPDLPLGGLVTSGVSFATSPSAPVARSEPYRATLSFPDQEPEQPSAVGNPTFPSSGSGSPDPQATGGPPAAPARATGKRASPRKKPERPPLPDGLWTQATETMVSLWGATCSSTQWRVEVESLRDLLDAGWSLSDIAACWRHFKSERFNQDKFVSLAYVARNIGAWRASHPEGQSAPDGAVNAGNEIVDGEVWSPFHPWLDGDRRARPEYWERQYGPTPPEALARDAVMDEEQRVQAAWRASQKERT